MFLVLDSCVCWLVH